MDGDAHCSYTVCGKNVARSVISGDKSLCRYSPGFAGEVVSNASAVVENASFSFFDRYTFRMKLPTGFTYRNLHRFARFPGDSRAVVFFLGIS